LTLTLLIDILGFLVFVSEVALFLKKRIKGASDIVKDQKSLRMIWRTIGIGLSLTFTAKALTPHRIFIGNGFEYFAIAVLATGILLRWYSIYYLGKQFSVNVAIIEGHKLIKDGPFRLIRHPSYLGLLLIFLGLGVHSNVIVGLIALSIPVFFAVKNRIAIEEIAMMEYFEIEYGQYRRSTKQLIPWIY